MTVAMLRVVLCVELLPAVKTRLTGAKLHVDAAGRLPQAKVTVPAKPPAGVTVMDVVPVAPEATVTAAGEAAKLKLGCEVIVMVCVLVVVAAANRLSPL